MLPYTLEVSELLLFSKNLPAIVNGRMTVFDELRVIWKQAVGLLEGSSP
jgi:hypothetical protein